jgi:hypothetical protein
VASDSKVERRPSLRLRLRMRLRRRRLDRELLTGSEPDRDPLILRRARQLTDRSARADLAGLLQRVLDVSSKPEPRTNAAISIQRGCVRLAAPDIRRLVDLLRGPDRISAQGVLMAYGLLVFAARRIGDSLRYGPSW